ncbi:MAG: alpha/beta hydrolase-fold protein [Bacteroidota bacterium]
MLKKLFKLGLWGLGLLGLLILFSIAKRIYEKSEREKYLATLQHTASAQVQVLTDTVYIDYLNEKRTLRVYLPKKYEEDSISYPVLYFFDAGSLFDEKVLKGPEWQLDEVLDSISNIGGQEAIVIGIDNSEDRMTEYKPYPSLVYPDEKEISGDKHAEWVSTDLKAWVDSSYRTKPEPEHNAIGGASLGGIMAYYTLMKFPEKFGKAFVFSPSFWVNEKIFDIHKELDSLSALKIYMNVGEEEGNMVTNAEKMRNILLQDGMSGDQIKLEIFPDLGHEHMTWRKGFKAAYPWILE